MVDYLPPLGLKQKAGSKVSNEMFHHLRILAEETKKKILKELFFIHELK
jgi:hypothetical protein